MITHHQIFRGSCDSIEGLLSPWVPNLPCLEVIDLAKGKILSFQFVTWLLAITWSENHLTLCLSFPHHKLPLCQIWWPPDLQKRRYFVFNLSRDLIWPRDHRVMCHYGWVSLIISLHPAKFGGNRLCAREEIFFFVCHMTSRQRVMWHYGWVPLVISDYPAKFGDHRPFGRGDIKLSICHVTPCGHVLRVSCDIMVELSSS